jgi:teichuronic acid biosynthesis glycosyltransferase TuaH
MDILFVGQQAWDTDIGSNAKNIAETFGHKHRVLYINSPLDRKTQFTQSHLPGVQKRKAIVKGDVAGLMQVSDNIWVFYPDVVIWSINWIPFAFLFDWANRYNNQMFAKSIRRAMKTIGFNADILFNDSDMFRSFYLPEMLCPVISIYYSRDNMLAVPYWQKHGQRIEPKLMAKSNICFANSTYLAGICKQYNPFSYYVGQGCDLSLFTAQAAGVKPHDLPGDDKPLIGYVGALLNMRLDIHLLENLAQKTPQWNYLFVGPEDDHFQRSLLHKLPNVFFLGPRPVSELPHYIQAFDVCLNPQKINPVTIGNYPRKIDEYLAMGKPIVATSTPFMLEVFGQVVYLADSPDTYQNAIAEGLTSNAPALVKARIEMATSHTWENTVSLMYQYINEYNVSENKQLPSC